MAPKRLPPKKLPKSKGLPWVSVACGAVVLVLALVLYSWWPSRSIPSPAAPPELPQVPGFDVMGDVPVVQFPRVPAAKMQGALQQVIRERTPLVLLNSPWTRWPANDRWKNASYLAEHVPLLKHVYRHTSPNFVYEDRERPLIQLKGVVGPPLKEVLDMATSEFLERIYSNDTKDPKQWHYFADVIGEDSSGFRGFEAVNGDIPNWEAFLVSDRHPQLPAHAGQTYAGSAHIWLHQQVSFKREMHDVLPGCEFIRYPPRGQ